MKISVFSLFRDSEDHIHRTLSQFEEMFKLEGIEFEFFFYENDSVDNTKSILREWCARNNGKVYSEDRGYPKFGSVDSLERVVLLSSYRNKVKDYFVNTTDSDYSIILDSDLVFSNRSVAELIKLKDYNNCSLMTGNSRNIKVRSTVFSSCKDTFYDVYPFRDKLGAKGVLFSDCPSILPEDLHNWKNNQPIRILSGFGGMCILKTELLRKVQWSSIGNSEHVAFCSALGRFGDIYCSPKVKSYVDDGYVSEGWFRGIIANLKYTKNILEKYEGIIH